MRVVAPSPVAGERPLPAAFMGEDTPEMRAEFLSAIPIGRFSAAADMGNAACFVSSPGGRDPPLSPQGPACRSVCSSIRCRLSTAFEPCEARLR